MSSKLAVEPGRTLSAKRRSSKTAKLSITTSVALRRRKSAREEFIMAVKPIIGGFQEQIQFCDKFRN